MSTQSTKAVKIAVNLNDGSHVILGERDKFYLACSITEPAQYNTPDFCIATCFASELDETVKMTFEIGRYQDDDTNDADPEDLDSDSDYEPRIDPAYDYAT